MPKMPYLDPLGQLTALTGPLCDEGKWGSKEKAREENGRKERMKTRDVNIPKNKFLVILSTSHTCSVRCISPHHENT